jgi:ATP-dependent Clp protease adaptor protein ClpS
MHEEPNRGLTRAMTIRNGDCGIAERAVGSTVSTLAVILEQRAASTEAVPDVDVEEKVKEAFDRGWGVIVWNDPVNLMHYVVHVFQVVLKMNLQKATVHMWEVHKRGKSLVAQENKERAEFIVHRLQNYGLKATMEPL